ncbi:MAG: archaemetzincin family Zn-dependent metalloprotease [Candidatus Helarchaeota archaeon]|nr:archaemetzincin family Zn-dependent metalloprotease [Candidatus Helarchaeota archaeon]
MEVLKHLQRNLALVFKEIFKEIRIIDESCEIPKKSYDTERKQYLAPLFLHAIRNFADENKYDKILGITSLDLFVSQLNFVFGMAELGSQAKAAVISLHHLYPEFFGQLPNRTLFLKRVVKEGLHEIGHTFGLEHCHNQCIMIFSNSILDTDNKPAMFCEDCRNKLLSRS